MKKPKPKGVGLEKIQKVISCAHCGDEIYEAFEDCHLDKSDYSGISPDKIIHGYFLSKEDAETILELVEDTIKQDFYCRVCKNTSPGGKWYCKDNLLTIKAIMQGRK